ncbi:sigma factor-like helix-turn-helix DNA-binding protein [Clostridium massiliamazoniense]|uniref:sigma factor-like helix-turn-helix DNA-binding protein n=1 Tax=Clostridium massiliamazoniense TaxID=1347366 RepID=UPI0006D817C4|nr:sigma factor-like helix-turn-helix DNA-binding protein [Clostridium massiliamazoniense]
MKASELLKEYKKNQIKIKNIEIEIEIFKEEDGLKAVEYKDNLSTAGGNKSIVENIVINNNLKIEALEKKKSILEKKQSKIFNVIKILSEDERKIIELRYFDDFPYTWYLIAERLNMSYGAARGIYMRSLKKIDAIINC